MRPADQAVEVLESFKPREVNPDKEPGFGARDNASPWLWGALALAVMGVADMMARAGQTIDMHAAGTIAFALVLTALGTVRWSFRRTRSRRGRIVRDMAEYFALFIAISLVGAVASYPVSAFSHGFVDAPLYRVDLALHFDWLEWYRTVAAHAWLQRLSRGAYAMIYVSPAVLLGYLAVIGERRQAHDFIIAVSLSAALTLAIFRFAPAVGPFAYLWHAPIPYLPVSELWQPDLIPQLRAHASLPIDLGHLVGLVSVPSFHAAAAVLLIAFAARQPPLRWPLIVANCAMLIATPVEGTHYFADMLAGVAVALAALLVTAALRRQRGSPRAEGANIHLKLA